jgi:predicted PhzF superfamily epimerase YddE/YHI9
MGISRYRYLHYDVFTDRRFGGNQLAVFPQAAGLSGQTMQQIAREIGFAETTFVLNLQGVKLGRPSWIHVSIESSGPHSTSLRAGPSASLRAGEITRVRVGGTSVFVAEGVMEVED